MTKNIDLFHDIQFFLDVPALDFLDYIFKMRDFMLQADIHLHIALLDSTGLYKWRKFIWKHSHL